MNDYNPNSYFSFGYILMLLIIKYIVFIGWKQRIAMADLLLLNINLNIILNINKL